MTPTWHCTCVLLLYWLSICVTTGAVISANDKSTCFKRDSAIGLYSYRHTRYAAWSGIKLRNDWICQCFSRSSQYFYEVCPRNDIESDLNHVVGYWKNWKTKHPEFLFIASHLIFALICMLTSTLNLGTAHIILLEVIKSVTIACSGCIMQAHPNTIRKWFWRVFLHQMELSGSYLPL